MTVAEVMKLLDSMGTAQNRKIYARHGYSENMFGVSFANLKSLAKKVSGDHQLALGLWETGNEDARLLATMIADPESASEKLLKAWMSDVRHHTLADLFTHFVAKTKFAAALMPVWMKSRNDFEGQVGWNLLGIRAMNGEKFSDDEKMGFLRDIEERIHKTGNRTRHAMNMALIGIGISGPKFEKLAIAAAGRIGKVEVDHGETGCKTPDAIAYIRKTLDRKKAATAR